MADRLKGAFGIGAIVASILCGQAGANVCKPASATPNATLSALPRAFGRYYEAENRAVIDAYAERARANGLVPSRSETCILPTGATSTRPTVRAVPPLSASAIRQREAAIAEIDAYLDAATAAGARAETKRAAAAAELRTRTAGLNEAANAHGQGDLFVEDVAAGLAQAIPAADNAARAPLSRELAAAGPIVRKLIAILTEDAMRQRADTIDATALAYRVWLAAGTRAGSAGPPPCSEPAVFDRSADVPAANTARSSEPRAIELRARARAAVAANPSAVLDALRRAIDAADSRAAQRARSRLDRAARNFVRQTAEGRL